MLLLLFHFKQTCNYTQLHMQSNVPIVAIDLKKTRGRDHPPLEDDHIHSKRSGRSLQEW